MMLQGSQTAVGFDSSVHSPLVPAKIASKGRKAKRRRREPPVRSVAPVSNRQADGFDMTRFIDDEPPADERALQPFKLGHEKRVKPVPTRPPFKRAKAAGHSHAAPITAPRQHQNQHSATHGQQPDMMLERLFSPGTPRAAPSNGATANTAPQPTPDPGPQAFPFPETLFDDASTPPVTPPSPSLVVTSDRETEVTPVQSTCNSHVRALPGAPRRTKGWAQALEKPRMVPSPSRRQNSPPTPLKPHNKPRSMQQRQWLAQRLVSRFGASGAQDSVRHVRRLDSSKTVADLIAQKRNAHVSWL